MLDLHEEILELFAEAQALADPEGVEIDFRNLHIAKQRERTREWIKWHPRQHKEAKARYRAKWKDAIAAKARDRYAKKNEKTEKPKNPTEDRKTYLKEYYEKHKQEISQNRRIRYEKHKKPKKSPEELEERRQAELARRRAWYAKNNKATKVKFVPRGPRGEKSCDRTT